MISKAKALAAALLASSCFAIASTAVMAQATTSPRVNGTDKVSMTCTQMPIQDAIKLVFHSEGFNDVHLPSIIGNVTVDVNEVTYDTLLRALLRSANPPLTCHMSEDSVSGLKTVNIVAGASR